MEKEHQTTPSVSEDLSQQIGHSSQINGPVAAGDGDAIDARDSQGAVIKPQGPVTQYFNTIYNFIDDEFIRRLGLGQGVGFTLLVQTQTRISVWW